MTSYLLCPSATIYRKVQPPQLLLQSFSLVREVAAEHSCSSSYSHSLLLFLPAPPQWRLMLEESSSEGLLGQITTFTWTLKANSSPDQSQVPWSREVFLQPSPAEQRLRHFEQRLRLFVCTSKSSFAVSSSHALLHRSHCSEHGSARTQNERASQCVRRWLLVKIQSPSCVDVGQQ